MFDDPPGRPDGPADAPADGPEPERPGGTPVDASTLRTPAGADADPRGLGSSHRADLGLGLLGSLGPGALAAFLFFGVLWDLGVYMDFVFPLVFFIGVAQALWTIPGAIAASVAKRPGILQGLLIGAGIIFLLNAACWGFFITAFGGW